MSEGAGFGSYTESLSYQGSVNWCGRRRNSPSRLPEPSVLAPIAHAGWCRRNQGMKMRPSRWKCLGVWLVPPFPSGFRPRIRVRGMLSIAGMTNSVAGTIHPGSESGTCFRARLRVSGWRPSPRWRRAWSGSCRGIRAALERVGFRQPGGKGPPRQDGSRTKDPSVPV